MILQPFSDEHLENTRKWINNPEISIPFLFDRLVTNEEHSRWFQRLNGDVTQAIFAIIDDNQKHIGNIGLKNIDRCHRRAELWIYIGDLAEQKKGNAKKAIKLLIEKAFDIFALRKLYLHVRLTNIAAIGAYRACGFHDEGILQNEYEFGKERISVLRMGIADAEWKAGKGPRVALMQPTFLPWIGYFELMDVVDYFVFLDDFQFSRQSWGQRNRIFLSPSTPGIITLPIKHEKKLQSTFLQIQLTKDERWARKFLSSLQQNYGKSLYFSEIQDFMKSFASDSYQNIFNMLSEYIFFAAERMGIKPKILQSSQIDYDRSLHRSQRVLSLLSALSARLYYSPSGSFSYMREDGFFPTKNIKTYFQDHVPIEYPQISSKTFVPYMSSLDVLCNISPSQAKVVARGTHRWLTWSEMETRYAEGTK